MDEFTFWVLLLPIVFMIHDFEEIIFFEAWFRKNKTFLFRKLPMRLQPILSKYENITTSAFALGVAEEFILLSVITVGSLYFGTFYLWLAVFMGFFIHLVIHIVQWIFFRKYIPAIITTFLAMPYCMYVLYWIIDNHFFSCKEVLVYGIAGFLLTAANLIFIHKLIVIFNKYMKRS